MPQPTTYTVAFDFTDFSASNPSDQQPGVSLDGEFAAIELTLGGVLANLALIQRDDGALANESVTMDSLSAEVSAQLGGGSGDAAALAAAVAAAEAAETAAEAAATASAGSAVASDVSADAAAASAVAADASADAAAASAVEAAGYVGSTWAAFGPGGISFTAVSGFTSATMTKAWYRQVGNIVSVRGTMSVDPSGGGGDVKFRMSLPVASNFAIAADLSGLIAPYNEGPGIGGVFGTIRADPTNNEAEILVTIDTAAATAVMFALEYEVI